MPTLLLIEDALDLAHAIQRELQAPGYTVQHAVTGEQAVEQFAAQPPELVILDWMLPGLDGLQVLRRIRAESVVPVLMLQPGRRNSPVSWACK